MTKHRFKAQFSALRLGTRLKGAKPATMVGVAVAVALVTTSGGVFAARATGLWSSGTAQVVAAPTAITTAAPVVTASIPSTLLLPFVVPVAQVATAPTWTNPVGSTAPAPTPTPTVAASATPPPTAAPTTPAPTTVPAQVAPTCSASEGFDLSLCGRGTLVATADSTNALPCSTTSSDAHCGQSGTGYAVVAKQAKGQLLAKYFPAFVACLPTTSALVDRFDCMRLGGSGESSPRPDNAFLEVWTDGQAVSKRKAPATCAVSASFSCEGIAVRLDSSALSVEYAASSSITCAGFSDETVGAVMVRCGYR